MLIDGRGQDVQMWRCNYLKLGRPLCGDIQYVLDDPFAAATTADLRDAYSLGFHGYQDFLHDQVLALDPVGVARRSLVWVRPDPAAGVPAYYVVSDDIEKDDKEHDYDWLLQLAPDNIAELQANSFTVSKNPATPETFLEGPAERDKNGTFVGNARVAVETPKDGRYWLYVLAGCSDRTGMGFRYYSAAVDGRSTGYAAVGWSESVWDWHGLNNQAADGMELKAGKHEIAINEGGHGPPGAALRVGAVALSSVRDVAPSFLGVRGYARREDKPEDATPLPNPYVPPAVPEGVVCVPVTKDNTALSDGWTWKTEKRAQMDVHFICAEPLQTMRLEQDVLRVRSGHGFWIVHPRVHAHSVWKDIEAFRSLHAPTQIRGRNPHFTALLYPRRADMERPTIELLKEDPPINLDGEVMPVPAVKVTWQNAVDYIGAYQARSSRPLVTQDLSIVRLPRADENLAKVKYLLVCGNRLTFRPKNARKEDPPKELLKVEDPRNITSVTVACSGSVLHIAAYPRPTSFWKLCVPVNLKAYGPDVKEVYVNGTKTAFKREGDEVSVTVTPERHESVKERIEKRRERYYSRMSP